MGAFAVLLPMKSSCKHASGPFFSCLFTLNQTEWICDSFCALFKLTAGTQVKLVQLSHHGPTPGNKLSSWKQDSILMLKHEFWSRLFTAVSGMRFIKTYMFCLHAERSLVEVFWSSSDHRNCHRFALQRAKNNSTSKLNPNISKSWMILYHFLCKRV